jgi:NTE family protein
MNEQKAKPVRAAAKAAPKAAAAKAAAATNKRLNLALQGGGAHGAFTWGVLHRLLEDPRIQIEGISGTSAGAMNAAVLACGYAQDGAQGACRLLDTFWHKIAEAGGKSPLQRSPWDRMTNNYRLDNSPSFMIFDLLSRLMSPYQLNPMNFHPLRDVLDEIIDYDLLRHASRIKLFIAATNVRTGKVRLFTSKELSTAALLASACLPFMFQAVEVDGECYYDGGYMGNPCIFPIIYSCESKDIIIVQINPLCREEVPTTAREIMDRVNEISFNSSLMREMRAIHFVTHLIDLGALDDKQYKRMLIHMIEADEELKRLGASSKLNSDLDFLLHLKDVGERAADAWLAKNFDKLGVDSTVDLAATYL